jgi:hypothetical protein
MNSPSFSPMRLWLAAMMAVCGIGKPSEERDDGVPIGQSTNCRRFGKSCDKTERGVALGHRARDKEDDEGTTQHRIGERFYAAQLGGASDIDTRQSRPVIAATDREFGSHGATRSQVLQAEFLSNSLQGSAALWKTRNGQAFQLFGCYSTLDGLCVRLRFLGRLLVGELCGFEH